MDDGLGDADALLITLGQIADQPPRDGRKAATLLDIIQRRTNPVARDAFETGAIAQVFVNRKFRVKRRLLRQKADLAPGFERLRQQIDTVDADAAGLGASTPQSICMVVDLPAPFGPRKPSTSPRPSVKLRLSTAQ
jgi:hypothetical protein